MAEFYKGFVFEVNVSGHRLTIEGNPIPVKQRSGRPGYCVKLPSGKTIGAASLSEFARRYISQSVDRKRRDRLAREHLHELSKGKVSWNRWRRKNPQIKPVLADQDLRNVKIEDGNGTLAGYDFSYTNLCQARMQRLHLEHANFHQAILAKANLSWAHLENANFCRTDMYETNFQKAHLDRANLQGVQMVRTKLAGADLRECYVYGLSAWDLELDTSQKNQVAKKPQELIVRYRPSYACRHEEPDEEEVHVEGVDLAAFMYLTLNNRNISRIIDAAGRKWVLLLGRFTQRKSVLEAIAEALKERHLIPIIFDFPPPKQRDLIETVMLLAGMSACVIVEITNPRSTPMELQAIVSNYGVPVIPIMKEGTTEFATFSGLRKFPWVRDPIPYGRRSQLIAELKKVIASVVKGNDPIAERGEALSTKPSNQKRPITVRSLANRNQ